MRRKSSSEPMLPGLEAEPAHASMVLPPSDEAELFARARSLAGLPLGELAQRLELPVRDEPRRAKGWAGMLLERALGASAASRAEPDFPHLGVELKTVPVDRRGTPRESTFVCTVALSALEGVSWEASWVRRKLSRVLFIPVEAERALPLPLRRIGMPGLWIPDAHEDAALRADWDRLSTLVARGDAEQLTAHLGEHLQIRPKGRNARALGWGVDDAGEPIRMPPRGFYLRSRFVATILKRLYAVT